MVCRGGAPQGAREGEAGTQGEWARERRAGKGEAARRGSLEAGEAGGGGQARPSPQAHGWRPRAGNGRAVKVNEGDDSSSNTSRTRWGWRPRVRVALGSKALPRLDTTLDGDCAWGGCQPRRQRIVKGGVRRSRVAHSLGGMPRRGPPSGTARRRAPCASGKRSQQDDARPSGQDAPAPPDHQSTRRCCKQFKCPNDHVSAKRAKANWPIELRRRRAAGRPPPPTTPTPSRPPRW